MKLFFFILGFLTFSTAMPSDIGRGQEVPSPESDRNSTQLHLAQPKVAATVEGINQSVEIRQVSPAVIVAIGVPTAGLVAGLVIIATLAVAQSNDDNKRKRFTSGTVTQSIQKWPEYSWIITHSPYAIAFDGVKGQDWGHIHHELPISFGRTIGYEIFCVKSGTFTRYGDGGYINWAYDGYVKSKANGGSVVTFGAR